MIAMESTAFMFSMTLSVKFMPKYKLVIKEVFLMKRFQLSILLYETKFYSVVNALTSLKILRGLSQMSEAITQSLKN